MGKAYVVTKQVYDDEYETPYESIDRIFLSESKANEYKESGSMFEYK